MRTAAGLDRARGSGDPPAESRRQDIQLFAIFGNGPASDLEATIVKDLGNRVVAAEPMEEINITAAEIMHVERQLDAYRLT